MGGLPTGSHRPTIVTFSYRPPMSFVGKSQGVSGKRPSRRAGSFLISALAALAMSACSSAGEAIPTISTIRVDMASVPEVTVGSALPAERFLLSKGQREQFVSDFNALVQDCAADYDLEARLVSEIPGAVEPASRMWAGPFGLLPLEHAKKFGYHAAPGEEYPLPFTVFRNEDEQPLSFILDGIQSEDLELPVGASLSDVPSGGCRGEITRAVGLRPEQLVPPVIDDLRLAAFEQNQVQATLRSWSWCMRDAGYRYTSIDQPINRSTAGLGRALTTVSATWQSPTLNVQRKVGGRMWFSLLRRPSKNVTSPRVQNTTSASPMARKRLPIELAR